MKGELRQGDDDFALRTLIGAINDFRELRDPAEIQDFLRRPRPTGDRRWDTLLAASVARACRRRGEPRTEVDPPCAAGVLVVPVRRWGTAGRPHDVSRTHRRRSSPTDNGGR